MERAETAVKVATIAMAVTVATVVKAATMMALTVKAKSTLPLTVVKEKAIQPISALSSASQLLQPPWSSWPSE